MLMDPQLPSWSQAQQIDRQGAQAPMFSYQLRSCLITQLAHCGGLQGKQHFLCECFSNPSAWGTIFLLRVPSTGTAYAHEPILAAEQAKHRDMFGIHIDS